VSAYQPNGRLSTILTGCDLASIIKNPGDTLENQRVDHPLVLKISVHLSALGYHQRQLTIKSI
jgi:hypothetical protein